MSVRSLKHWPICAFHLDEEDQDSGNGLNLGFDCAEDLLRYPHLEMRPDPDLCDDIARNDRR